MLRKLFSFVLISAFCTTAFSQAFEVSKPADTKPKDEASQKLETEAIAFLREAIGDAANLRSLENRITFSSELARIMWPYDERDARQTFGGVISDLSELIAQLDGRMNAMAAVQPDEAYSIGLLGGDSDRSRIARKFANLLSVRQAIANSLGERDAEMAYGFYYNTRSIVTNPEFRRQMETRDAVFEIQLLTRALAGNSPRTAQLALRSMESGFRPEHVQFLKQLYGRDPEKAAEFAAAILARLRSDKIGVNSYAGLGSLLNFAATTLPASRTPAGRRAVYSQSEMREIAEMLAQTILNGKNNYGGQYAAVIDKYSPGRGAQIRARVAIGQSNVFTTAGVGAPPPPRPALPGRATMRALMPGQGSGSGSARGRRDAERDARQIAESKLMADIAKLGNKEISRDDRGKLIEQARKIISETPAREKKIAALGMLAAQVSKAGDKELAAEIMSDAYPLVETTPRNYRDFLLTWTLIGAQAEVDAQKAFPLLEDTILRSNETIAAFIKAAEFMDVAGDIIVEGEVQVGSLGGSMIPDLTGALGVADPTLRALARSDFARTRELAAKFERPEVRILAKILILRAVMDNKGLDETQKK